MTDKNEYREYWTCPNCGQHTRGSALAPYCSTTCREAHNGNGSTRPFSWKAPTGGFLLLLAAVLFPPAARAADVDFSQVARIEALEVDFSQLSRRIDEHEARLARIEVRLRADSKIDVPAEPPPPVVKARAPLTYYDGIGSGWTWPGDLRHHIATYWFHGGRHSIEELNAMTDAEVMALHDAEHNEARAGGRLYPSGKLAEVSQMPAYYRQRTYTYSSNCPGGRCPAPTYDRGSAVRGIGRALFGRR